MTRRRAARLVVVSAAALAGVALLVPGTPAYLPNWFAANGRYDGHSLRYWVEALDSPDAELRYQAIDAVGRIGPDAAEAVPALATILQNAPKRGHRINASLALTKMAPATRAAVPALAGALNDEEPLVRMNAALALFRLGAEARPAVPALLEALRDKKNQMYPGGFALSIQEMLMLAVGRASAGSAVAVPVLTEGLRSTQGIGVRLAAARALGEVGPEARSAEPLLRELLREELPDFREAAEEALHKLGRPTTPAPAEPEPANPELPEPERAYLWEIEHHGNLLAKHGFGPFASALKRADAPALARLLAEDFTGTDLGDPHRVRAATDYAEVERVQDAGRAPVPLSRAGFVARLLEFRGLFAEKPPQVKLALMTLHPKVRGQLDGPWEGTAQLRLHGEHAPGAPAEVVAVLHYEVPRPTEEALTRPGWLRAAGVQQVHTAQAPRPLFAEVARERGLDPTKLHDNWTTRPLMPITGGVYVCDFDRDGVLDVLVTDFKGCTLYRGRPDGTFEDVTDRFGLPRQPDGPRVAAWVDVDGDGWEDLLLADRVYRNDGGRRFLDYTTRSNLSLPRDAIGVVVADYDRDGRLDLYVTRGGRRKGTSWLDGKSGDPQGNYLFRNKGDWQFEDVTQASGALGGHRSTFTAAWLDANNDGWPDLHVINEFGDGVLLVNNRDGTFTELPLADHPVDFGTMGVAVGDIDNDGNIDIYCADMYSKAGTRVVGNLAPDAYPPPVMEKMRRFVAGSELHLNKGGLKFEQAGKRMQVAAVGWAYGACLADLDNDGWLDLYATAGYVSRNRDEPDG
jgi:FG-GAP-like repeat/HEAT repeats